MTGDITGTGHTFPPEERREVIRVIFQEWSRLESNKGYQEW